VQGAFFPPGGGAKEEQNGVKKSLDPPFKICLERVDGQVFALKELDRREIVGLPAVQLTTKELP
jgi:hypothetical protein